ncbi:MAG: hypothetical protein IPI78_10240 [Chitinophagaceae bacterium]|nr:hypothetical protein [Chitinophagaceae bacterium]
MQNRKDLKITTNWLRENNKKKEADEADQFLDSVEFSFFVSPNHTAK